MKKTTFMKTIASVALATALAACGGGGGGGSSSPVAATQKLSGKAIDGYLAGATVCFDNGHGACDPSLPSTTTDANGNYTLNVTGDVTGKQIDVIVTPQTTDNGQPFTSTFALAAIVSNNSAQNITPLTTMVIAQMKTGKTSDQATASVQQLVGSNVDPNADYVASGDTNTTSVAASMVSHMTALGGQGTLSWAQVQATMNAYVVSGSIIGVQQSDVDAQLANPALSQAVDATSALASSLYTIDGDLMQMGNGAGLTPVRENFSLNGSTLSMVQEKQRNGAWSTVQLVGSFDVGFSGSWISNDAGVGAYLMKADGTWTNWLTASQLHPSFSLSTVGSTLVGTDPNTNDQVTVSYRTMDVSGQPLSSSMQIDYRNPIRQAMTGVFPSGTTAYLSTQAYANDRLMLVNQGLGLPWINGQDDFTSNVVNGSALYTLGDPNVTYTSVQQVVGAQNDIAGGCLLMSILPNGVATIDKSGFPSCDYSKYPLSLPVTGSWSVYPRNPNVITISFPKAIGAPNVPIIDGIKDVINMGGSLVVGLMNGKLMGGYMLPASAPTTVAQFRADAVDLVAASMRSAASGLGITQNP
jgi:hypothetical protein